MDKRKINLLFNVMSICGSLGGSYMDYDLEDIDYFLDQEVVDCQLKLYMAMLVTDEKDAQKKFAIFEKAYKSLTKEKQEYIKRDLKKILQTQEKNEKEKEKIL